MSERDDLYGKGWRLKTLGPSIKELQAKIYISMSKLRVAYRKVAGSKQWTREHLKIFLKDLKNKRERIVWRARFKGLESGGAHLQAQSLHSEAKQVTTPHLMASYNKMAAQYEAQADKQDRKAEEWQKEADELARYIAAVERKLQYGHYKDVGNDNSNI